MDYTRNNTDSQSRSTRERRNEVIRAITSYVTDLRADELLKRKELSELEGLQRHVTLSKGVIPNLIRRLRRHPRESAGGAILCLIHLLCDNNDGICSLTIKRMATMFNRTERCVRDTIDSLEEDGLLNVERVDGWPSRYWPNIPSVLAQANASVAWFVDALSDVPRPRGRPVREPAPRIENPGTSVPPISRNPGTSVPGFDQKTPEREGVNPGTSAHSISLRDISKRDSHVQELDGHGGVTSKRAAPRSKPTMEQFDRFWAIFPKRAGKAKALERFMALTPAEAERAISGASWYATDVAVRGTEDRYVKMAQGWLNERRFEDIDDGVDPRERLVSPGGKKRWGWWKANAEKLRAMPAESWERQIAHNKPNGTWPWWMLGPPPGDPECLIPEEIVARNSWVEAYNGQILKGGC